MITQLRLKFGSEPAGPAGAISPTPVTVFVGPNNSGKSKVLTEIFQFCATGQTNSTDVLLDSLEFASGDESTAIERISRVTLKPYAAETALRDHVIVGKRGVRHQVVRSRLIKAIQNPQSNLSHFCAWYLQYNTLILNGQNRIALVNQQPAGDMQQQPHTCLQVLFRDDERRKEVRRIIHDAFGVYFVIDPSHLGHLRIRLSSREPASEIEERGIHEQALQFHSDAQLIDHASDGVKAFTGMITEIIAGDPAVLLIDEPEAFLHPALAFKLGLEIARASLGSDKRLFVSTHSPNFVMGCIQSGAPINIVRLTYRSSVATARLLPNVEILTLMRNPLLRSTGVLSGLFYEFVVVSEADADRAFYQEINERLQLANPVRGIPNCLFINAQNKQTVQTILRPLRRLGIPAAAIVDIDVLKDGGSVWSSFLECAFIPEIDRTSLSVVRAAIKQKFDKSGKDMKRCGGIEVLEAEDREAARNLLERLAEYGLFVVSRGELESWLPGLLVSGHGPAWLVSAFEKMGEDPTMPSYLRPSTDDVWEFIDRIGRWLKDPKRKGIPGD